MSPTATTDKPLCERERFVQAVSRIEMDQTTVETLVDMLLTLPKADRAMCLFNSSVLAVKIGDAKEVLKAMELEEAQEEMPTAPVEKTLQVEPPKTLATLAALSPLWILKYIDEGLQLDGIKIVDKQAKEDVDNQSCGASPFEVAKNVLQHWQARALCSVVQGAAGSSPRSLKLL